MFFNGQPVWHTRRNGREHYKFVSMAAVIQAFRNAPVDSGWLPSGVVRCGGTAKGDFAVLFIPARRHTLSIESSRGARLHELTLWLPSLVFFGIGAEYHVWALKEDSLEPRAALHHAPLSNVFTDGRICWGENSPPKASSSTISQAWDLFIKSPFNEHAASGKSRTCNRDVRVLLRRVARSRKRFPLSELVAAGGYGIGSLEATINGMIGGDGEDGY